MFAVEVVELFGVPGEVFVFVFGDVFGGEELFFRIDDVVHLREDVDDLGDLGAGFVGGHLWFACFWFACFY